MLVAVRRTAAAQPEDLTTFPNLEMLESGSVSSLFPGVLGDMVAIIGDSIHEYITATRLRAC